ncbi:hypothetical protein ACIOWI_00360 [Streptomyces sp. NPDC087659]|uniref:hypothetical protein n=1 Tax=unclassified Streptomyces TaxID=2593676 RepID=UPI0036A61B51
MDRKHKVGPAAVAAVLVAVPAGLAVRNQTATAEREAEERSLEQAAEEVLQRVADAPGAQWRTYAPPGGDVRNQADAKALVRRVGKKGARFTVDVDGITTPYTSDPYGRDLRRPSPTWGSTGSPSSATGVTGGSSRT